MKAGAMVFTVPSRQMITLQVMERSGAGGVTCAS